MLARALAVVLLGVPAIAEAGERTVAAKAEPDPTYLTLTARVENPSALRPSRMSLQQGYAVAVCLGRGGTDGPGCVPVFVQSKRGAQSETKVAIKRLVELAPLDRLGRSIAVQSIRVRRNELLHALGRAAGLAGKVAVATGTAPPVDMKRAQEAIARLAVGRRKQVHERPLPAPKGHALTLAFELDPKNKEAPRAIAALPNCEGEKKDPLCGRPHVVLELRWDEYSAESSQWIEPIATGCRLPKGQTTTSIERDLDAAAVKLSPAQMEAERRMLRLASAMLDARGTAHEGGNLDKAATHVWRFLDDANSGTPGLLWERHYADRVEKLEHCVAHLEIYPTLHELDQIMRREKELDETSELVELARLMRALETADAQHNEVYGEANRRRAHLEIEPMQRLEKLMKAGAQPEVETFLSSTPCGRCQSIGQEWLRGQKEHARAQSNETLRKGLLDTEVALRDMERGMQARQRDLAEACQSYGAGRTSRLLDDLREDQKTARDIVVKSEFDDDTRARMFALRERVLGRLPEVASWLALPVANRCVKK